MKIARNKDKRKINVFKKYHNGIKFHIMFNAAKPMDAIKKRIGSNRNVNLLNAMEFNVDLVKYVIQQFMIMVKQRVVLWMMLNKWD